MPTVIAVDCSLSMLVPVVASDQVQAAYPVDSTETAPTRIELAVRAVEHLFSLVQDVNRIEQFCLV